MIPEEHDHEHCEHDCGCHEHDHGEHCGCHEHDHGEHCGCHGHREPDVRETVKCPKCGTAQEVELYTTLHAGDPAMNLLLRGTLNRPTCLACGTIFLVDKTITYSEDEPPFIVYQMSEPEDGAASQQLENEVDAMATDIFYKENLPRPTVRLTFDRPDFIEKIAIHKLGFDDRLIEYAKLQLYRTLEEPQLDRSQHKLMFDWSHCDDQNMFFLIFDKETLKPVNAIQVPMAEFHALEHALTTDENVLRELDAAFPGCHVSAERLL
ncbi:MAG: hypothetical protein IJJ26_00035 [Victivallales bacterium]|nr:hypothetical protein [Victivallales bacterium]